MARITRREQIEKIIESKEMEIGIYDEKGIKGLNKTEFENLLEELEMWDDSCDRVLSNRRIAELPSVDSEIDIVISTKREYLDKYGDDYSYLWE